MSLRKENWFVVAIGSAGAGRGVNFRSEPVPVAEAVGEAGAAAVRRVTALAPFGREIEVGVIGRGARSNAGFGLVRGSRRLPALLAGIRRMGQRLIRLLERLGVTLPLFAAMAFLAGSCLDSPAMACEVSVGRSGGLGTSLRGTVRDREGDPLPGVSVCLTHAGLGVSRMTLSDGAGRYQFSSLPPGNYSLQAEREGYQPFTINGLRLRRGEGIRVDVVLVALPVQPSMKLAEPRLGGESGLRPKYRGWV